MDRLGWPEGSFDAAVAVNSIQLWDPLDASIAKVATVLRPQGQLVTPTHAGAIERTGRSIAEWLRRVSGLRAEHGLNNAHHWQAQAENGTSVALTFTKESEPVGQTSQPLACTLGPDDGKGVDGIHRGGGGRKAGSVLVDG